MKQLFPKEIIENSQENNFSRHSVRSQVVYMLILTFLITLILLLPVIHVDVGVRGSGMIRPATEVITLAAPVSGRITSFEANDHSRVAAGDPVAAIDHSLLELRLNDNRERQRLLQHSLLDLQQLLAPAGVSELPPQGDPLITERYRAGYAEFQQQIRGLYAELDRLHTALKRDSTLYAVDAVSFQALEERRFLVREAEARIALATEQQRNRWVMARDDHQRELLELQQQEGQLQDEIARHQLLAPVSGTILNRSAHAPGSFVFANQPLAELSPDTILVAEVYIHPKDIGLLREGMAGRFQIDAFNHTDWGSLSGRITAIPGDVTLVDSQPLFRVRCELDSDYLELPNGFRGELRRGMTFQVRFMVARRSLLQLIRDRADNWLNPASSETPAPLQPRESN